MAIQSLLRARHFALICESERRNQAARRGGERRVSRAGPFRQRIEAALAAAQAAGCARVTVKTCDGASFEFNLKSSEVLDPLHRENDFDAKPPKRDKQ